MKPSLLILATALGATVLAAPAAPPEARAPRSAGHYAIETVPAPSNVDPQVGALAALPGGRMAAAFHHGEIAIFNPADLSWKIVAEGLHEPLGLLPEKDGSLLVMQRPELTRLRDTDGDGDADSLETVWADFGMTGNYHEFAFGPVRAPNGKVIVALNLASNGDTVRKEVRGDWTPIGLSRERFFSDWKNSSAKAGRMYSRVPYRGWVLEIDPATGAATPLACGFRSPDGIGFDAAGNLLVDDNQGDWRGSSELHVVKPGGFYGHPASLVWRPDWTGEDPLAVPIERLNALRTPAAVWFPQNIYANSPTQIVVIPKTLAWGPFGGQTLVGEMNSPRLLRLLLEEVGGVWQGACINLLDTPALKAGVHRLAWNGDTLWVGHTHLSWAGSEGINTVRPTGLVPFDPLDIHVTPTGFRVTFTEPLAPAAADPALWPIERYTYAYHATYGSPQLEKVPVAAGKITLSADARTAEVELPELRPDFIYDFDFTKLANAAGLTPLNPHLAYTLRKVPAGK